MEKYKNRLSQTQVIAIGFFVIISIGAFLLSLPISSRDGQSTSMINSLFTATSATCVTGLIVADTFQKWTIFGQILILIMIQIGGLGFMTIGVFFSLFLRRNISLKERGLLQESVNTLQIGGIVKLTKKIMRGTMIFESIGAVLLSIRYIPKLGWARGIYYGVFHSISAFCNAGFDLMGRYEEYSSFTSMYDDWLVNLTIMLLIIIGGIGFIVWDDISKHGIHLKHYMLHTKIVLTTTFILVFGGALLFYIFERNGLMYGMSSSGKILSSLFSSVTARTAGFNTIDTAQLSESSRLLTIILMFIGGSPGSTAGGIKTTTIVVLFAYVWSNIHNSYGCNIFNRRLADDAIKKASTVFVINLSLAILSALIICTLQPLKIEDIMFEVFSAIGTVGMSTGITRELSTVSRIIIILLMYCGRIGSLTFALSFIERRRVAHIQQPIEQITIG